MSIKLNSKTYKYYIGVNEFTPQTRLIIQRATDLGYTLPNDTRLRAIDKLIKSIISIGMWDRLNWYSEFAYNDTSLNNFSKINWKNPYGLLIISNGAITYTTQGWKGNAVDSYLDTQYTLTSTQSTGIIPYGYNYTQDNATIGVTLYQAFSTGPTICSSNVQSFNWLNNSSTNVHKINSGNNLAATVSLTGNGLKAIIRDDANNVRLYNKGVETITTQTSTALATSSHCILKRQSNFGDAGVSNAFMGLSLTATQISSYRTAYNNYLTSIGLTAFA